MADERIKVSQLPRVANISNFEVFGVDISTNASAKADMEQLRGNAGATGASPVIQNGTIATGEPGTPATMTLTLVGNTPAGEPLYRLDGSIPQGIHGMPPVIQNGTIQTGAPGSAVTLTLTANGSTPEGNPIYVVDGSIPQGQPGTGSGNVVVETTGIVQGGRYVFVAGGNNSAVGTFVSASPIHKQITLTPNQWVLQPSNNLWGVTFNDTDISGQAIVNYAPSIETTQTYVDAMVYPYAEVTNSSVRLTASSQPAGNIDLLYTIQL